MTSTNHIFIYAAIFSLIFFPYIFVQMFFSSRRADTGKNVSRQSYPPLFRHGYWLFQMFSENIGRFYEKNFPASCKKLQNDLLIANIRMDAGIVFTAQLVLGLFLGLFLFFIVIFLFPEVWIACIGGAVGLFCGYCYPKSMIESLAQKRQQAIIRALPFAIDLLASAMKSGLDFSAAIRYYVSNESGNGPLAVEFAQALREMELGKTRIEALEAMGRKIRTEEFTTFISALIHGTEVGASIVDTLKIQGTEMRRARFNLAERKAAKAPSIMILPIALFIMPAFFLVVAAPIFIKMQNSAGMGALFK